MCLWSLYMNSFVFFIGTIFMKTCLTNSSHVPSSFAQLSMRLLTRLFYYVKPSYVFFSCKDLGTSGSHHVTFFLFMQKASSVFVLVLCFCEKSKPFSLFCFNYYSLKSNKCYLCRVFWIFLLSSFCCLWRQWWTRPTHLTSEVCWCFCPNCLVQFTITIIGISTSFDSCHEAIVSCDCFKYMVK